MFGEKAVELLRELKRAREGSIPPYGEDTVRQWEARSWVNSTHSSDDYIQQVMFVFLVIEEMRSLFEQNQQEVRATTDGEQGLLSGIQLRHTSLERNHRCLLAYVNARLGLIKEMRWEVGAILPEEFRLNLCEEEIQWFQRYNRSLGAYMRSVGDGDIDLTLYTTPPKSLYIEVRCLSDYGELVTDDGTVVQLKEGSQHHLLRSQCEHLIRQGVLEHIQ